VDLKQLKRAGGALEIWPTQPWWQPTSIYFTPRPARRPRELDGGGKEIEDELAHLGRSHPDCVGGCDRL
jgi:hypothetical protein